MYLTKDVGEHKTQPDRPAVEVTEEMIEAGAWVLRSWADECFDYSTDRAERVVAEVFLAMARASRSADQAAIGGHGTHE